MQSFSQIWPKYYQQQLEKNKNQQDENYIQEVNKSIDSNEVESRMIIIRKKLDSLRKYL
ncbi:unnamed protein product [Paramecium sonneborni]|uniref:Uncharacterized protein n=1 Tax=Paramecium sonneborni TaxID=65129 RepID=A0A8S1RCK6_9CILI|nr:unnamed protein product [Paramecium sonneborni]